MLPAPTPVALSVRHGPDKDHCKLRDASTIEDLAFKLRNATPAKPGKYHLFLSFYSTTLHSSTLQTAQRLGFNGEVTQVHLQNPHDHDTFHNRLEPSRPWLATHRPNA